MAFWIGPYITDYGAEKYFNSKKKINKSIQIGRHGEEYYVL